MRIGEFAEVCETRISVLRHYDKEGLLLPNFIDRFTGYRYYSANQVNAFRKITALKKAGFSLKEIKTILSKSDNTLIILDSINKKKSELKKLLSNLEEAKKIMLGAETMQNVIIIESTHGTEIRLSVSNPVMNFYKCCEQLEEAAKKLDYQRISNFKTYGEMSSDQIDIGIGVIKLCNEIIALNEDINVPFINDDVIGKWEVIGDYTVKDDFFSNNFKSETIYGGVNKQIFFLPDGEKYWCYGWTKGFLIIETGDSTSLNSYEVEEHNGERYMFIQNKSYYYRRGGNPSVLVLHQLDEKIYTRQGIARKDNIKMPFKNDKAVLGKWKAFCFLRTLEEFDLTTSDSKDLYFKEIEFLEDGNCTSIYGEETISGDDMQVWTKGYVLRKFNNSACAYEIRIENNVEYLIMEWKSGDYRWGGFDTDYYVFVREKNNRDENHKNGMTVKH